MKHLCTIPTLVAQWLLLGLLWLVRFSPMHMAAQWRYYHCGAAGVGAFANRISRLSQWLVDLSTL